MRTISTLMLAFPLSALFAAANLGPAVPADAQVKPLRGIHVPGIKPDQRQLPLEVGSSSEGFRLYVKVAKPSLHPDEPIFITIVQQNVTDSPLPFYDVPPEFAYDIQVTAPEHRDVPLTRFGQDLQNTKKHGELFGFRLPVPPRILLPVNGAKEYRVQINRLFDMTRAGDYVMSVQREIPTLNGRGHVELVSYPVTVSVSEAPGTGFDLKVYIDPPNANLL